MANKNLSIGVDIGGTHITCAAVKMKEGVLLEDTLVRATYSHEAEAPVILRTWADALNQTLAQTPPGALLGIGFAMPGPFDYLNGISKMQQKLTSLYELHIPAGLSPFLQWDTPLPMRFLNDAASFAVGEAWLGKGAGHKKMMAVTLGTGFGSAFIEDGVPVVERADVPKDGCVWYLPYGDGIADEYFSTGWFKRQYKSRTGNEVSGVKALAEMAETDAVSRQLFAEYGSNMAAFLGPWLQKFGAEVLVLGGNISRSLPLFEQTFRAGLAQQSIDIKTAVSRFQESAALIGSARLLDDAFWQRVSAHLPEI